MGRGEEAKARTGGEGLPSSSREEEILLETFCKESSSTRSQPQACSSTPRACRLQPWPKASAFYPWGSQLTSSTPRLASPWPFSVYLSPWDLAAPHPQQGALLLPASLGCVEKGGEAPRGKEKARGCCSCCWAPESGLHLQSLSGQAPVPCGHLGHPKSREETKPEQSKEPFHQQRNVRQLLGVLDPDTGTASTSGGEAVVGKVEGQKPFPNMLKGFVSCLGFPPTSAQHKTASGCQSATAPQHCQRGVIQSRITPGSSLVAPASFKEGSQQPLGTTQTFTRLEQDETRHRARPRGQQTDTDSECPWRKGFRRPPRRFWTIW